MNLQEIGWGDVDWIDLAQDRGRQAGSFECGIEPWGSVNTGNFLIN